MTTPLLPGGLAEQGRLARDFQFRELDGQIELAICAAAKKPHVPDQITAVLHASLAEVAGGTPTVERIERLCIADRQYLVRHLVRHLRGEPVWLTSACRHCGARFDFRLSPSELPYSEAGPSFPEVRVVVDDDVLMVRVPSGGDQRWVSATRPPDPRRALVERCLVGPQPVDAALSDEVLDRIDEELEAQCPEVTVELATACPECGEETSTYLEPYQGLPTDSMPLLRDVHRLACTYHWSEDAILALPRERRTQYLDFIDESRGMVK